MNKLKIFIITLMSLVSASVWAENNTPTQTTDPAPVPVTQTQKQKQKKPSPSAVTAPVDPAAKAAADQEINSFNPDAHCRLCKIMQEARAAIDPTKKADAQANQVTAGHDAMLKAMNGFDSIKTAQSPEAMQEYMQQLIVLFERLDRVDPSTTAVERISAFMDDADTKKPLMSALKEVPEALRKKVLERIRSFNKSQQDNIANPASATKPASPGAGNQ